MTRNAICLASACWLLCGIAAGQRADVVPVNVAEVDPLAKATTIAPPDAADVQQQVFTWLESEQVDVLTRGVIAALWESDLVQRSPLDRLESVVLSISLTDDRAMRLHQLCSKPRPGFGASSQPWLTEPWTPAFLANNLRLYYGRWLAQQQLYDECLEQLAGLAPGDVVDPASLLFYQAVAYHRLLRKSDGLAVIERLLEDVSDCPQRYLALAGLMREDLQALRDESLDHIARRMDDIRRRLDLARAGPRVRTIEDGVIASLDKLIEEMEKQQQQQQGGGGSSGAQQPSSPMPDSRLARAQGAGDVDRRNIGNSAGWGDLPAKQREEALQQIGKDFPAHYRDVIEQYFRRLATEGVQPPSR